MRIRAPLKEDFEVIRNWRNANKEMLRTPFMLTEEMQAEFYYLVVCNRKSSSRFYSVVDVSNNLLAVIGLENIQWENRTAEMSCILKYGYEKYLKDILDMLLNIAFGELNLNCAYTEVYECSEMKQLWETYALHRSAHHTVLPQRKFYDGKYHNSTVYSFFEVKLTFENKGDEEVEAEQEAEELVNEDITTEQ